MLKNLRVHELAVQFYQATRSRRLPNGLSNQLGRAASSVALNLSEGWGRRTEADRRHFFHIALGSIRECQTIVRLEQQAFSREEIQLLDRLAAGTYKLVKSK